MTTPETRSLPAANASDLASVLDNAERGSGYVDQDWICKSFSWTMEQLGAYIKTGFPRAVTKEETSNGKRYLWDARQVLDWQAKNRPQTGALPPPPPRAATQPIPQEQPGPLTREMMMPEIPPPIGGNAQVGSSSGIGASVALDAEEQIAHAQIDGPTRSPESRMVSPDDMLMRQAAATAPAPKQKKAKEKGKQRPQMVVSRSDVDSPPRSKREYKDMHRGWRRADYKAHGELAPPAKWPVPFLLILVIVGAFFGYKSFVEQPPEQVINPNTKTAWEQRLEEVRRELLQRVDKLDGEVQKLDGEVKVLEGEVAVLNEKVGDLETDVARVDGELDETQKEVGQQRQKLEEHNGKIEENKTQIDELTEKNVELVRNFERNREQIETNQKVINQLKAENETREKQTREILQQIDDLGRRQTQLEAEKAEMQEQLEVLKAAQDRNGERLLELHAQMKDLEGQIQQQAKLNAELQAQMKTLQAKQRQTELDLEALLQWAKERGFEPPIDDSE